MAIVYRHRRLDTNEVFYVGIGLKEDRAYQKRSRNILWQNIVNKSEYSVEILVKDIDYESAKELEILLIELYGRYDLGLGTLSNMTDGGDGNTNMSEDMRGRISKKLTGLKQSEETKEKRRQSLIKTWSDPKLRELKRKQTYELNKLGLIGTKGIPSKKKGIKLSDEHKEKTSKGLKKYYENNKPVNFIELDVELEDRIYSDYLNAFSEFELYKKYGVGRCVIKRVIKKRIDLDIENNNNLELIENLKKNQRQRINEKISKKNKGRKPCLNRKFINNGLVNKIIKPEDIDEFLNNGWVLGILKKQKN